MMKKILFSIILGLCMFYRLSYADYPARTKILFDVNISTKVKAGEIVVPAGTYTFRDLGIAPYAVLSLTHKGETDPLAILYCARIDRRMVGWADKPAIYLDLENGVPLMKKIYLTGEDGYQIISAIGKKEYTDLGIDNLFDKKVVRELDIPTIPALTSMPMTLPEKGDSIELNKFEQIVAPPPVEELKPLKERIRLRKD